MSAGAATPHGELAGKTVLVTGASRGVGRAIVERLATTGATVVAHYARPWGLSPAEEARVRPVDAAGVPVARAI